MPISQSAACGRSAPLETASRKRDLGAIAGGPVFSTDSKFAKRSYDTGRRASETAQIETRHGDTLRAILDWAGTLRLSEDVPESMPNALLIPPERIARNLGNA